MLVTYKPKATKKPASIKTLIEDIIDTHEDTDIPIEVVTLSEAEGEQLVEELAEEYGDVLTKETIRGLYVNGQVDYKTVIIKQEV